MQEVQSLDNQFKGHVFVNFILYLFKRQISAFIVILGRRGTGKTDFALLIAEMLIKARVVNHVATNIKIYESPFHVEAIDNLDDLKKWAKENKGRKLFIFDEIGKGMKRRTPMSSLNVKLIDQFHILRKYKLSIIATTINEKYVDQAVLGSDILDGYFDKPNFRNPKIALYVDYLEDFEEYWYSIPATIIKFDTWDSAPFKEHGKLEKPKFKEEHLNRFWEYSQGKGVMQVWKHQQLFHQELRKFLRDILPKVCHTS